MKIYKSRISILFLGAILAIFVYLAISLFRYEEYSELYFFSGTFLLIILLFCGTRYIIYGNDKKAWYHFWAWDINDRKKHATMSDALQVIEPATQQTDQAKHAPGVTKSSTKPWYLKEYPLQPKPLYKQIFAIIIVIMVIVRVGNGIYQGEKEPVISILDNSIQIKSTYRLNVDFSTITGISLIEKSMKDISTVRRTSLVIKRYNLLRKAYKGYFRSDHLGDILLFVQYKSSPTILIERADNIDIYISFRDGINTVMLYNEMKAMIRNSSTGMLNSMKHSPG